MPTRYNSINDPVLITFLSQGGVAIIPTDTIYGIVGKATIPEVADRISNIKKRGSNKSFILLINTEADLKLFGVPQAASTLAMKHWPGPTSVILPTNEFMYLDPDEDGVAFRLPDDAGLRELVRSTGPLIATSANLSGEKTVSTINEAEEVFAASVPVYVDGGKIEALASRLIKINEDGSVEEIRKGAAQK